MNYNEYQELRKTLNMNEYQDFGKLNLYEAIPGPVLNETSTGHNNGRVHRCHLAEDFCRVMSIPYQTRSNMAISYGVRDALSLIMHEYSNKQWVLPSDVYPWYQKEARQHNIRYNEYGAIGVTMDIPDGDILLLCIPLKPDGRQISNQEIRDIIEWKRTGVNRQVIIDCAYCLEYSDMYDFFRECDFTLLFSLSKIWSHPNIMGFALLSKDLIGIRDILAGREMDKSKMHMAFNLLNRTCDFPEHMKYQLKYKQQKLSAFNLTVEASDYGYLFYVKEDFNSLLERKILAIPLGVYGNNTIKGAIISTL